MVYLPNRLYEIEKSDCGIHLREYRRPLVLKGEGLEPFFLAHSIRFLDLGSACFYVRTLGRKGDEVRVIGDFANEEKERLETVVDSLSGKGTSCQG